MFGCCWILWVATAESVSYVGHTTVEVEPETSVGDVEVQVASWGLVAGRLAYTRGVENLMPVEDVRSWWCVRGKTLCGEALAAAKYFHNSPAVLLG